MTQPLLSIRDLKTHFFTRRGAVKVLDGLNLDVQRGQIIGLVGETGSGKSVTGFSTLRMVRRPGRVVGGEILFEGRDLLKLSDKDMREVRGREIAMIFQDPRASLNPVLTVGQVLRQVLRYRRNLPAREIEAAAIEMLRKVHIADPERRLNAYPHQLSGGMCQRVMIALTLACQPKLLIADEPTTGLDVTIQQQIVLLLKELRDSTGMSQIVITHDLGLAAELCDAIAVMYAGEIVEFASAQTIFAQPRHPYTLALLKARPIFGERKHIAAIPGNVPDFITPPSGCRFHPRCTFAFDRCATIHPPTIAISPEQTTACLLHEGVNP